MMMMMMMMMMIVMLIRLMMKKRKTNTLLICYPLINMLHSFIIISKLFDFANNGLIFLSKAFQQFTHFSLLRMELPQQLQVEILHIFTLGFS